MHGHSSTKRRRGFLALPGPLQIQFYTQQHKAQKGVLSKAQNGVLSSAWSPASAASQDAAHHMAHKACNWVWLCSRVGGSTQQRPHTARICCSEHRQSRRRHAEAYTTDAYTAAAYTAEAYTAAAYTAEAYTAAAYTAEAYTAAAYTAEAYTTAAYTAAAYTAEAYTAEAYTAGHTDHTRPPIGAT
jgi:hypothetical protein